ncbi:MAG: hypothetical protein IVW57_03160 [Ktedonobacterales bacterium]|nr:hypothetical protein [Ktedonobacterales bacterium]
MGRRRRGRRGGGSGSGAAQWQAPMQGQERRRDLEAEAATVLRGLLREISRARALYGVAVRWASDEELRRHRYDDERQGDGPLARRLLPRTTPDALLVVGCTAPSLPQHKPQIHLAQSVMDALWRDPDQLSVADIERGERLLTLLNGVAAVLAARAERGMAGRFVGAAVGRTAFVDELRPGGLGGEGVAPVCPACMSAEAAARWHGLQERGAQREQVERLLRSGARMYVTFQREPVPVR